MTRLKIAIIGASGHYGYVLNGLAGNDAAEVVGIAPGSEGEDLQPLAEQLDPSVPRHEDYRHMLDETQPDVAAINCYFGDHARVAVEVLERGIHTFVEKPVATTLEGLEEVREAYRSADVSLAAMLGLRYEPCFLKASQEVDAGAVGEVRLMTAQKSYRLGRRGDNYQQRDLYGGTIPWVGCHAIDWLNWFTSEKFEEVFASHSACRNRGHGDLEMTALCHFRFTGEVFGGVNIDYLRPETAPSHGDDRLRVAGTEGVLEVRGGRVYLINDQKDGVQELLLPEAGSIFADFLREVRGQGECMLTAEDSLMATEAALKARQSADTRQPISF